MDYTGSSIAFKARKVTRYIHLYGAERTIAKVQGQRHMRRRYASLPELHRSTNAGYVGLIGAGNYAFTTIAHYLNKNSPNCIRGVMDIDLNHAASLAFKYRAEYYTDDVNRVIEDPDIRVVFIASNHASHAEYAVEALRAGKAVHVEKPHSVSEAQLSSLVDTMKESGGPLAIGYNRPSSRLGATLRSVLAAEQGAGMYNWFVAGHELPADHWYFAEAEGGRVLGNMCHWIDFLYQLVPDGERYPVLITPTVAHRSDCDVTVSYVFADGTIGVITFSAKGHAFEGVREHFSGHKGNALVSLRDFQELRVDIGPHRHTWRERHRDHGHERRIVRSLRMADDPSLGDAIDYVRETGELMLATRKALESRKLVLLGQ